MLILFTSRVILAVKGRTSYTHTTMAEKGNLSNSRLKRAIDNRWCESYITRGGVSVMGALAAGTFVGLGFIIL